MHADLHDFLARFVGMIAATLIPVALIAFVTIPASLHHHIGEPANMLEVLPQHMT